MAGTTSSIISNLLSSLERFSQFMPIFTSSATSSSSSITHEDVTAERFSQFMPIFTSSVTSSSTSITHEDATVVKLNSIEKCLMKDLSRFSRMLQRIQAILHYEEKREIYDKGIQLWFRQLREVAYDAEDVLDQYDYQVIKTQLEGTSTIAEANPSLKKKQVDDIYIFGYQDRTALMAMHEDWVGTSLSPFYNKTF